MISILEHSATKILVLILFCSLIFNLTGISAGLPQKWAPDEITDGAITMFQARSLDPVYFTYGSLHQYILVAILLPYVAYYFVGGSLSEQLLHEGFRELFVSNLFLISRIVSAFLGTLLVYVVYLITKRIASERAGLLAASLTACSMVLVTSSHVATVDVPTTVLTWITLFWIYICYQTPNKRNYLLAGLLFGLAVNTKYYTVVLALPFLVMHLLVYKKSSVRLLLVAVGASLCSFFATNPYLLFRWSSALQDFSVLFASRYDYQSLSDPFAYLTYVFHFENGLGMPLFVLGVLGIGYCVLNSRKNHGYLIFLSWFLVFYLIIGSWRVTFLRYILPIVPVFTIAAAIFVDRLLHTNWRNTITVVFSLVLLFSVSYVLYANHLYVSDSRILAATWIENMIPTGSTIGVFSPIADYNPRISSRYSIIYLNISQIDLLDHTIQQKDIEYLVDSSLYYNRYILFPDTPPRAKFLVDLYGRTRTPDITFFYKQLLSNESRYPLIAQFPTSRFTTPQPEFINPDIVIFKVRQDVLEG